MSTVSLFTQSWPSPLWPFDPLQHVWFTGRLAGCPSLDQCQLMSSLSLSFLCAPEDGSPERTCWTDAGSLGPTSRRRCRVRHSCLCMHVRIQTDRPRRAGSCDRCRMKVRVKIVQKGFLHTELELPVLYWLKCFGSEQLHSSLHIFCRCLPEQWFLHMLIWCWRSVDCRTVTYDSHRFQYH